MESAFDFIERWCLVVSDHQRSVFISLLHSTDSLGLNGLFHYFIDRIQPYRTALRLDSADGPRESDCLASGIVFFYGCIMYVMHFPGWGRHIEALFLYSMLYLLVDHLLDDQSLDQISRKHIVFQLRQILTNRDESDSELHPELVVISATINKLVAIAPAISKPLLEIFEAEVAGIALQSNGNSSRLNYRDIAYRKGALTMAVVQAIVGDFSIEVSNATSTIGALMQLIDDSIDVYQDKSHNIHTIATHDLENQNFGSLDNLWFETVELIRTLPPRFRLFTMLYSSLIVYIPGRHPAAYSKEIRDQVWKHNIFGAVDGAGLLAQVLTRLVTASK